MSSNFEGYFSEKTGNFIVDFDYEGNSKETVLEFYKKEVSTLESLGFKLFDVCQPIEEIDDPYGSYVPFLGLFFEEGDYIEIFLPHKFDDTVCDFFGINYIKDYDEVVTEKEFKTFNELLNYLEV